MTWTWPTPGVGSLVALVVLLLAIILAALHLIDLPEALVVCAICAVRL